MRAAIVRDSEPKRQNMKTQMKTLGPCGCRPGQQRDNCPACEGTGQRIDFAAHRAAVKASMAVADAETEARAAIEASRVPAWMKAQMRAAADRMASFNP